MHNEKLEKTIAETMLFQLRVLLNGANFNVTKSTISDGMLVVTTDRYIDLRTLNEIKKRFLHTNTLDVTNANQLIYMKGGKLHMNTTWINILRSVYEALLEFEKHPVSCTISGNNISFKYSRGRTTMTYDQLKIIQDFINPACMLTDNLFVVGMDKEYTVYVKLAA